MGKWKGVSRLFWQPAEVEDEERQQPPPSAPPATASVGTLRGGGQFAASQGPKSEPTPVSTRGVDPNKRDKRILEALGRLRDVEGVLGGLALGPEGALVVHDLPPRFGSETPSRLAARLRQLQEALVLQGGSLGTLDLRFAELRLQVAPVADCMVGVLADRKANSPALSMALDIAAKRIQAELVAG